MKPEILITHSTSDTEAAGFSLAKTLNSGDFVAMFGGLGAGKTAFVRGAMAYLSPGTRVQSPTYTIVNEYPGKIPVFHFDMYRVEDGDSLYAIGYDDYLDRGGICFAEWSENIVPWLPEHHISVTIEKNETEPEVRRIVIERTGMPDRKDHV